MIDLKNAFDGLRFRMVSGNGFSIGTYPTPGGFVVRYFEGIRHLTVFLTIEDETDQWGRSRLFLRTFGRVLHIPSSIKWDSGPELGVDEALIVFDRIRSATEKQGSKYRLIIDDKFYDAVERDLNKTRGE